MNRRQLLAIRNHCRLGVETMRPIFAHKLRPARIGLVLTVCSGYECIEKDWGGPVWSAFVGKSPNYNQVLAKELRRAAVVALDGVGNADLGEWEEADDKYFLLRRRLSKVEELVTGPAADIRDTDDAVNRAAKVVSQVADVPWDWIKLELGPANLLRLEQHHKKDLAEKQDLSQKSRV